MLLLLLWYFETALPQKNEWSDLQRSEDRINRDISVNDQQYLCECNEIGHPELKTHQQAHCVTSLFGIFDKAYNRVPLLNIIVNVWPHISRVNHCYGCPDEQHCGWCPIFADDRHRGQTDVDASHKSEREPDGLASLTRSHLPISPWRHLKFQLLEVLQLCMHANVQITYSYAISQSGRTDYALVSAPFLPPASEHLLPFVFGVYNLLGPNADVKIRAERDDRLLESLTSLFLEAAVASKSKEGFSSASVVFWN